MHSDCLVLLSYVLNIVKLPHHVLLSHHMIVCTYHSGRGTGSCRQYQKALIYSLRLSETQIICLIEFFRIKACREMQAETAKMKHEHEG